MAWMSPQLRADNTNAPSKLARSPSPPRVGYELSAMRSLLIAIRGRWSSCDLGWVAWPCRGDRHQAMASIVRSSVQIKSRTEQVAEPSHDGAVQLNPSPEQIVHSPHRSK